MEPSIISEELVTVVQLIRESEVLQKWFLSLAPLSPTSRAAACADMASFMQEEGEEEGIITAVSSLSRPEIYNAILQALQSAIP